MRKNLDALLVCRNILRLNRTSVEIGTREVPLSPRGTTLNYLTLSFTFITVNSLTKLKEEALRARPYELEPQILPRPEKRCGNWHSCESSGVQAVEEWMLLSGTGTVELLDTLGS